VLVGTDSLVAFTRSDAVSAVMEYLTSQEWARTRMALGGVATANQGVDPDLAPSDVGRRATRLLQSRQTTVEMDASDSMPEKSLRRQSMHRSRSPNTSFSLTYRQAQQWRGLKNGIFRGKYTKKKPFSKRSLPNIKLFSGIMQKRLPICGFSASMLQKQ